MFWMEKWGSRRGFGLAQHETEEALLDPKGSSLKKTIEEGSRFHGSSLQLKTIADLLCYPWLLSSPILQFWGHCPLHSHYRCSPHIYPDQWAYWADKMLSGFVCFYPCWGYGYCTSRDLPWVSACLFSWHIRIPVWFWFSYKPVLGSLFQCQSMCVGQGCHPWVIFSENGCSSVWTCMPDSLPRAVLPCFCSIFWYLLGLFVSQTLSPTWICPR